VLSTIRLPAARPWLSPLVTGVLLLLTAFVPVAGLTVVTNGFVVLVLAVAGVVGLSWLAAPDGRGEQLIRTSFGTALRPALELALHLSPVALLTLIFPIATVRLSGIEVGGTALTTLLLGSSLTVPWLGQAVCMPLYRALGVVIHAGDQDKIQARFVAVWPAAFVQSLPALVVFAVPVEFALRWSPAAFSTYLVLIVLHLAFAQSLVLANIGRRRLLWAVAWTGYAAVLFALPRLWYLPPLVGTLTQLVPLRHQLRQLRRPAVLDTVEVFRDLRRGLLLGAVLWADKFFLFIRYGNDFPVTTVFLALLPAILAYNYYFVRLAPRFDAAVLELRGAMENERFGYLTDRSMELTATVNRSIKRTAFVGAVLGLVVTMGMREYQPHFAALVAAVSVASWLFMMTTVVSYKLDYIGQLSQAQLLGAVHLVLCMVVFAVLPLGAPLYAVLIVAEAVLFGLALRSCLKHWGSSEYTLFWRHAVAW